MFLVQILVSLFKAAWPLPDFKDEAAVLKWLTGLDPVVAKIISTLATQLTTATMPMASDHESIARAVVAELQADPMTLPADLVGKLGDGTILKLLIENMPAIIQMIMTIIGLFAKKPPAPGPVA